MKCVTTRADDDRVIYCLEAIVLRRLPAEASNAINMINEAISHIRLMGRELEPQRRDNLRSRCIKVARNAGSTSSK